MAHTLTIIADDRKTLQLGLKFDCFEVEMSAKKLTLFVFSILLILAGTIYGWKSLGNRTGKHLAAEFVLKDVTGSSRSLAEFRGKRVLLHFWASWCSPCLEELPVLVKRMKSSGNQDLKLVTISWDQSWSDAKAVIDRLEMVPGFEWVSLIDPERKLGPLYGTYQLPETYLINAQQEIEMKWVGSQDWAQARFDAVFLKP